MYPITNSEKGGHAFKGEWGGVYGTVWRKGKSEEL